MNDPHVTALHYWVNHDDSVDYTDADPLQYEHELFHLEANGRNVLVKPKDHYASEEEARTALVVSHVWNRRDRGGEVCPWRPGC